MTIPTGMQVSSVTYTNVVPYSIHEPSPHFANIPCGCNNGSKVFVEDIQLQLLYQLDNWVL